MITDKINSWAGFVACTVTGGDYIQVCLPSAEKQHVTIYTHHNNNHIPTMY